jgi:general stress protein YciG
MRGQITQVQEHVIQCGRCPDLSVTMQTGAPHATARRMGWSKRKGYGWICPECVTAIERQREALKAADAKPRGFASPAFDKARQREIAAQGGTTAQATGKGRRWSTEEARAAGRKGGQATARNRNFIGS